MPVTFRTRIRFWDPKKRAGLAVADVPKRHVDALGGRRQSRVTGTLERAKFTGSTMLVRGGGLCIGISKAAMRAAGVDVGKLVTVSLRLP
jgi:hypothetical protein